eukprot:3029132-Pyramimonas_sp.AAC.1
MDLLFLVKRQAGEYRWRRREKCVIFNGPVILDKEHEEYVGANKYSNNTGELEAILFGCTELYLRDKKMSIQELAPVVVLYDSEYAAKMATGRWKPKSNIELIMDVRKWVRRLQASRT